MSKGRPFIHLTFLPGGGGEGEKGKE